MAPHLVTRIITTFGLACVMTASNAQTNFNAGQAPCSKAVLAIYSAPNPGQGSIYAPWSRAFIEGYFFAKPNANPLPSFETITAYLLSYCANTGSGGQGVNSSKTIAEGTACWINKNSNGSCTQGDPKR